MVGSDIEARASSVLVSGLQTEIVLESIPLTALSIQPSHCVAAGVFLCRPPHIAIVYKAFVTAMRVFTALRVFDRAPVLFRA